MEDPSHAISTPPPHGAQVTPPGEPPARAWPALVALLVMAAAVAALVLLWPEDQPAEGKGGGGKGKDKAELPAVRTTLVARDDLDVKATYRGELDADAVDVGPDIAGRLIELHVRLGDEVEAGQVIARLDADAWRRQLDEAAAQLRASQAAVRRTATQLEAAQREQQRQQQLITDQLISVNEADAVTARVDGLLADKDTAAAQVDQARARMALLRERVDDSTIKAPFKGRIVDRLQVPGAYLQAGQGVVRLVATGDSRVRFEVPEQDIVRVRPGAGFDARVASDPVTAPGEVVGIASEVDRTRRIVRVEGQLEHKPEGWLPGMYVEVVLDLATVKDATVVPSTAVLSRPGPQGVEINGVFRLDGDTARWVPVQVLGRQAERVAVGEGVRPGESVLSAGHHALKDGSKVLVIDEPAAGGAP